MSRIANTFTKFNYSVAKDEYGHLVN